MFLKLKPIYYKVKYPPLWKVKHDIERGELWRKGVPEVFPLNPDHRTYMREDIQILMWELFRAGAPRQPLDRAKKMWRQLYDYRRAFSNKAVGFDGSGEPLADFINKWNLEAGLPAFDKPRTCGGASVTGTVIGDYLEVETINADEPMPPTSEILKQPWLYFYGTTVRADGSIGEFPQGSYAEMGIFDPVFVPFISRHSKGKLRIPLADLIKLPPNSPPANPYIIQI